MARTSKPNTQKTNIAAPGTGAPQQQQQQQGQIPATFLYNTIIPTLETAQQQCLTQYAALTGLIVSCQILFGSSLPAAQRVTAMNPGSAASPAGQPVSVGAQSGAQQSQVGGIPSGPVDASTTIDTFILNDMNKFPNGFTSQEMRQHLQGTYGAIREKPFSQNHVTNALRKHWESDRLLAVGGNPLAKQPVERWYVAGTPTPPASAYTLQMAKQWVSGQQPVAA